MFNFLFGNPKNKNVWFFTRMFFFMLIPVFGLFYTVYLAFIEDRDNDIKKLAKGALIIRILAVILLIIVLAIGVHYIMQNLENWLNNYLTLMRIWG